ncbi:unnamed protein product [Rotaria socialis]|uniref:Phytanoyl-CoA dioxygenase n=1 Tax=Rotaria socialis TaxID=392032 RepID=A0A818IER9_9BILA|nr:unnamed protein product [Rotaria socialis]CAF4513273.1 unnamed protein product [Rotaria socialis]
MATATEKFQPPTVPRDSEGFVKSFNLSSYDCPEADDACAFFDQYGFVVIANVFTPEQCAETISDIWNVVESFAEQSIRNNENLWDAQRWRRTGYEQVGLVGNASLWTRQIILNRQTPALHTAFAAVLGTRKLLTNHDRYALFRPAQMHSERGTVTNLHLDMNPWIYLQDTDNSYQISVLSRLSYKRDNDWITENNEPGCSAIGERHVQGLVNLTDNLEEDGGFWLVPGFHKYLPQWTIEHENLLSQYGLCSTFNLFKESVVPELYAVACHISSRAGSAILWDQRTMHGSRANNSLRPRYAQFFKMFPAEHPAMTEKRAENRRNGILTKLRAVNINPETDLSFLGRKLFGLEQWSD